MDRSYISYIQNCVDAINDGTESVGFGALLGDESKMSDKEKKLFATKAAVANNFASALSDVIFNNKNKYPILSFGTKGPQDIINHYQQMDDAEVYLPYEQEFDWVTTNKLTVTYEQTNNYVWSTGDRLHYSSTGDYLRSEPVSYVDDDYAYREPTMVLKVRDFFTDERTVKPVTSYWLTSNVNHADYDESKIVRVIIPKIRMTSNYQGLFYGSNKLRFYRVYGELVQNAQGFVTPTPQNAIVQSITIKRGDARKGIWIDTPGSVWDQDWQMRKSSQRFVVLLWHRIGRFFSANISASVKFGWDFSSSSATANANLTLNGQFTVGECETVYDDVVDRRVVMSSITGNIGSGTMMDSGVGYAVRNADRIQYYFKYHITEF